MAVFCALTMGAHASELPTFGRDIAPLLREKCGDCHAPGGPAPFALNAYAEVRERAGKIARIALDGLMPPWLPAHAGFSNARRLSGADLALLRRWAEAGAPEGDAPSAWPSPVNTWQVGQPDMILTMPQFYAVPAKGELQTVHFVFPLNLKEPRYLRAVEVLPGNRQVVLQANALFDQSGRARALAGETGWYERFGDAGFVPSGMIAAYAPGRASRAFDDGVAMLLSPNTDLVLQVRYRPRGEQEMDVTRIGLYFAKDAPVRSPSGVYLGNQNVHLEPGVMEEVIRDSVTLRASLDVREIRPNLLRFGRGVRVWAEPPAGKRVGLIEIQDWDYTWQDTYTFAEPIQLPKGTVIKAEWTISNPRPIELRAGDTPADESPALWIGGVVSSQADHVTLTGANLSHYKEVMKATTRRPR